MTSILREPDVFDEPRLAHTLRQMLAAILAFALAISAVALLLGWRQTAHLTLIAAAASLLSLLLSRSGRTRPAILLLLLIISYVVLHLAATGSGITNIGLAILPVLIVLGSVVWNLAMLLCFTAGTILATASMLAIRYYVLQAEPFSANDMGDLFVFSLTCATAALLGRLLARRIEENLRRVRESERRYRGIFENVQDVYCEMSTGGVVHELSPASSMLFGIPRESLIGRPLAEFCAEESCFDALLKTLRTKGRLSNSELAVRDSRGELHTVLVNASLQKEPETGEERVIGSIRDITARVAAEEALRESEARLRLALDATGAGTFDFELPSQKLICSEITKSHFGVSPQAEADYATLLGAVHPDDRELVHAQGRIAVYLPRSGGHFAAEFRVIGVGDGKERWIVARGRMLFDKEKRPVRMIGTTLDISELKRLEEDLRRRAEELQTIMDVAPVALITAHDAECREVTANRMGKALFQLAAEPSAASDPLCSAPTRAYFRDGIQLSPDELPLQVAARDGVEVRDVELETLLPSGERRILLGHASPLRDAAGRVRGSIAAVQDVTEARKRAEALLRESEERFRNTADAAPVIMWFGDTEKRLTFVNEQFVRFTGLSSEQLLGDGWAQVLHPDDLEAARAIYYESVERRAGYQLEYRARRADGEYRHMLGTTCPRYVGSEYAGQVGSVVDITDLKNRHEENLAHQKLESLGVLAAGIAHDFNNLLGGITANAELAAVEIQAGSTACGEIETIKTVAERAAGIVRQLMDYAGQGPAAAEQVDIACLVADMLDLLKVSISKNAASQVDLAENLPAVRANASQIRQLIMNLVTNASEAIGAERNGLIKVGVSQVRLNSDDGGGVKLDSGSSIRLTVSDNGCGMAREVQARMFDPFYTTKFTGRGLGLAVVQGIVRSHHGAIHVATAPGAGTSIEVFLPCLDHPVPEAREAAAPRVPATLGGIVLVVEDEEPLRIAVGKLLRKRGFSVLEAADGAAAADLFQARQQGIKAILLDMTIPGKSSRDVAAEVRRIRPEVKVIIATAYSLENVTASFAGIRLDGYLRKPYRMDDLVTMLSDILARSTDPPPTAG